MAQEFQQSVTDAVEHAHRNVSELLIKPESLEKLEALRIAYEGKKQRVESRLRSVVQTQLDGVQQGLKDLQQTVSEIKEIKAEIDEVGNLYASCKELGEKIGPIREVYRTHQELRTTYAHLEKIYDVPAAVARTNDLIKTEPEKQNLLVAHRELSELEHIRDELLIQLYHSKEAYVDKNTALHRYFQDLDRLKGALGQQIWDTLEETIHHSEVDPRRVVTAMKIVEREEKIDVKLEERLSKQNIPLKHLPGRPVKWRKEAVWVLEQSVRKRFKRFEIIDMVEKGWMKGYLTDLGRSFFQDLVSVKNNVIPLFPKEYQIFQFYVTQYHLNLSETVERLIKMDLDAGSILMLMSWAKSLSESVLSDLQVDLDDHGAIVPPHLAKGLEAEALKHIRENVLQLNEKLVTFESERDWNSGEPPEEDIEGHLQTTLPRDLFEVIQQNIDVMKAIGGDSRVKAMEKCWECMKDLQTKYNSVIEQYAVDFFTDGLKAMHDRGDPKPRYRMFMPNMIACANNCLLCIEYLQEQKEFLIQELKMSSNKLSPEFEATFLELRKEFQRIGCVCLGYLVDLEFENLRTVLKDLCTRDKWLNNESVIMSIIKTVEEYNRDFLLLKNEFHDTAVLESHHRLIAHYSQAMMEKRIRLQNTKQRETAKEQVFKESRLLSDTFQKIVPSTPRRKGMILQSLAELWVVDKNYILPEIMKLQSSFDNINANHVIGLLATRGDITKSKLKELLANADLKEEEVDGKVSKMIHGDMFNITKKSPFLDVTVKNPMSFF